MPFALLPLLLLLACEHRTPREPAATTPLSGDYLSAVVPTSPFEGSDTVSGWVPSGRSTEVVPGAEVTTLTLYRRAAMDTLLRVLLAPLGTPAQRRFVAVDDVRGLRVIDAAAPAHAQISAGFSLPASPQYLQVVGERALLVFPQGTQHALWWLDLSAPSRPVLLHAQAVTGAFRGAYLTHPSGQSARLHTLVDYDEQDVAYGTRHGTMLREFELADRALVVRHELELGATVTRVERARDVLFVSDDFAFSPSARSNPVSVRQLEIGHSAGPPVLRTARSMGSGILATHADDAGVRVVWSRREQSPEEQVVQTFHVERWPWIERRTLGTPHDCVTSISTPGRVPGGWLLPPSLREVQFLRGRTTLEIGKTLRVLEQDTCALSELPRNEGRSLTTADETRVVRLVSPDERTLRIDFLDAQQLASPRAQVQSTLPAAEWGARYHEPLAARVFERGASTLLAVPVIDPSYPDSGRGSTQLFELKGDRFTRFVQFPGELWLAPRTAPATLLTEDGLAFASLASPPAAQRLGELELWAVHTLAMALPGGSARVRAPRGTLTSESVGRLEFVPRGSDPQTGRAIASFALPTEAQLHRVGSTLVAISRETKEGDQARTHCRIQVFDTRDFRAVRRVATLDRHASLCETTDLFLPLSNALLFVSPERRYAGREPSSSRFSLHVLDLRDAQNPRWHGPFRTPEGEFALRAHVRGSQLVYAYRVAAGTTRPAWAHHYLRAVDLSDPTLPRFDPPVSVAGEVMALAGDAIYTRDAAWTNTGLSYSMRKLRVRGRKAVLLASHALAGREVTAIAVPDPATLLLSSIGAAPDRETFVPENPQLGVFDPETLAPRGALRTNDETKFVTASAGVALYETYGDVHVADYREPNRPRLARILPSTTVAGVQGENVLLLQSGVLRAAKLSDLAASGQWAPKLGE